MSCSKFKKIKVCEFVTYLLPHNPEDAGLLWIIRDGTDGTLEIDGPCGVLLTFSEKICYFHHYIRWSNFLLNEKIQSYIRKLVYDLARFLTAQYAVYVPDSGAKESSILDFIWDDENKDMDYIRNWLLERCGAPKAKIADIHQQYEDYWESEGYYIDYFDDLQLDKSDI
ncbi:hypothetical protein [Cohnella sp. GCM10012308]|uniref:hypothetical protein n=1 Tax=Cohnella sp. GCM10012308 TaxID=3317329 RepID=UPI003617ED06